MGSRCKVGAGGKEWAWKAGCASSEEEVEGKGQGEGSRGAEEEVEEGPAQWRGGEEEGLEQMRSYQCRLRSDERKNTIKTLD